MFIVGYILEVFCIFLMATCLLGMVRGAFFLSFPLLVVLEMVCLFVLIFVEWLGQEEFLPF